MQILPQDATTSARTQRFVRPARFGDAPAIARIQADALRQISPDFAFDEGQLAAQWEQTLRAASHAGHYTLVATDNGVLAGFALLVPAEALTVENTSIPEGTHIAELLIAPEFTRVGHASRLLQAAADLSRGATLRTWISAEDEARVRFFHESGFAPAGVRRSLEVPGAGNLTQHLWWSSLSDSVPDSQH